MADFTTSTHRAKWIFTPHDLDKYKAANHRAKQALEKYGSTKVEVNLDGSISYAENTNDLKGENQSRTKPLKVEEEHLLRAFYEFKIQDVSDAFKFPRKIQATALIYFKRFYLQWSVMEHHPKHIMLTCIYAACKAEENHISAEELGKGIEQDHHVILNNEMLVLQSLGFDLIVFAPYRALDGFITHIEEYFEVIDDQLEVLQKLHESAKSEVDKIMRTDAPLLFPPGQLALAALCKSNEAHEFFKFDRYLRDIICHQIIVPSDSDIGVALHAVDCLVNKLETPTTKEVKHIDRKLKSCLDPGSSQDKSKKREHRFEGRLD